MRAIILEGNNLLKEKFISDLIKENEIPSYNVHKFDESLKIAEAREIKRILSRSAMGGKLRIILVSVEPTPEAQNALLKTVEELPDDTFVVFSNATNLLPTINSRCLVKRFGEETPAEFKSIALPLEGITSASEVVLFVDKVFDESKKPYEDLLLSLRQDLLDSPSKEKLDLFRKLNDKYPLVTTNNLNQRMVVERCFLEALVVRSQVS